MYKFLYYKDGTLFKYKDDQGYIHDIDHVHKLEKIYKVGEGSRYYKYEEKDGIPIRYFAITKRDYYYIITENNYVI